MTEANVVSQDGNDETTLFQTASRYAASTPKGSRKTGASGAIMKPHSAGVVVFQMSRRDADAPTARLSLGSDRRTSPRSATCVNRPGPAISSRMRSTHQGVIPPGCELFPRQLRVCL